MEQTGIFKIIDKIKKKFPEIEDDGSKELIEDIEKRANALQEKIELQEHNLIKTYIAKKKKELEDIDEELRTNREMTDEQRKLAFIKKDLIQGDLDFFGADFEKQMELLESKVKGYLKKLS